MLLISKRAPGLSAYNQVERRMASLNKALSGILLPYETFGTYLDLSRKTIDTNLEKRNFKAAGDILAKVWEEIVLGQTIILNINNIKIRESQNVELLGLIIDNRLTFKDHINMLCRRANYKLHALRRIRKYLTLEKSKLLYNAFINNHS